MSAWAGAWLPARANLRVPEWYKVHRCFHPLPFGATEGPGFGRRNGQSLSVALWRLVDLVVSTVTYLAQRLWYGIICIIRASTCNCQCRKFVIVWTILRENSCIAFEAKVLILHFGAISCDMPLYQSGLKIASEIIFQNSSCSNFIKVLCSIDSLLKLEFFLKSSK